MWITGHQGGKSVRTQTADRELGFRAAKVKTSSRFYVKTHQTTKDNSRETAVTSKGRYHEPKFRFCLTWFESAQSY